MSIKCETPVDPYSFVEEEMSMGGGGMRTTVGSPGAENMTCPGQPALAGRAPTPPGPLASHQMSLVMNGAVNPQVQQPKKRGRKRKAELILTPDE